MSIDAPREMAVKILYDIDKNGAYSNISLGKHLDSRNFKDIDRAFITELVYGILKWKLTIDYIISRFSRVKLKKISPWILNILRIGVYQIIFTDKVPVSAACNESVKLAKRYGHAASSKYVNGVLRNISRDKERIKYPDKKDNLSEFLSVSYSHPLWMIDEWIKRYGEEFTEELLKNNNQTPHFTIRTNTLKTSKTHLKKILEEEGFEVDYGQYMEEALIIKNPKSLQEMDAFKKGYFQVQDESSMLVASVLNPEPNDFVLDVCSAPGGKTTHLAQLMDNKGTIVARDIHEHKIQLISQAAKRLGIDIIKTEIFDATLFDEKLEEKADKVLVDAPCTGLGIIRRKPDIKWTRKKEDKNEIVKLQKKILSTSSKYVRKGGIIVYSTCTIEPEENQYVIEEFLDNNKDFYLEDAWGNLPETIKDLPKVFNEKKEYIQLYPNKHGVDGFFIAKLKKRS
ncbi:MAG: 16S rRNA (cytosine(967)-C(5))-methyltransferase RsmB [Clostridium sp.]|nr:16S rRNA (cytosine(967)-C(5))-methyltransferase RsmB [Clostridium sp.]